MTLPIPPAYNQLSAKTDPSDDCGETCVAAALTALGHDTTVDQTVAVKAGLTSASDLVNLLHAFNSTAVICDGAINTYLPSVLERGHYCIVGITSDGGGNPLPGSSIGHWLLCYDTNQYLNPYGGRLVGYTNLSACDLRVGVEIVEALEMTNDVIRGVIRVAYWAVAHREPDEAGLDFWTGQAAANGLDATLARMMDNGGEFPTDLGKDEARDQAS